MRINTSFAVSAIGLASFGSVDSVCHRRLTAGSVTLPPVQYPAWTMPNSRHGRFNCQSLHPGDTLATIPRPIRALVVEDDSDYAFLVATLLRREGMEAIIAQDGYRALERVTAEQPDLVVLDLGLPLVDGCDVLQELRELEPQLPIIVVSGALDAKARADALGATAVLVKPLDFHEFLRTVESIVGTRPVGLRRAPGWHWA